MAVLTLEETKQYLRVDSSDEDSFISGLIETGESLCADVARMEIAELEAHLPMVRIAVLYAAACRMVRIIVGSLQSPVYLRLRLRLLLMPAHARRVGQYLVTVPVIHMDSGARPPGLELSFIRLPEQEAQPPPVSLPYRFHVRHFLTDLPHQRLPVRRDFGDLAFPQGEELIPHIDALLRILPGVSGYLLPEGIGQLG